MVHLVAIDDEVSILDFIEQVLARPDLCISRASDPNEGWELIRRLRPQIVTLDQSMPGVSGMELLARIVDLDPTIDVVLLTADDSTDLAVEAIRQGASDFLTKPITPSLLREKLDLLIVSAQRRDRATALQQELLETTKFGDMVGQSPPMLDVFALIRRIAPHFRSCLVTGATGTGKELVARALHQMSLVRNKPFVVCNCAAIVETLFESELFGHVRGSFTGATVDRAGLFEAADGGTLFLDEIGEVPLKMQAKFLRALQNGEVQRVGSNAVRRVNVRVVAATNRDLRAMVKQKDFREDLYYRLSMLEIPLPVLADRKEDLPLLERHFLAQFSRQLDKEVRGLSRRAQTVLSRYSWPGNIRELENVIGHACTMTDRDIIDVADLPAYVRTKAPLDESRARMTLADVESRHVRYVYEQAGGNKQLTAEILGVSRATLYRYLGENGMKDLS
ncbi:MAG: Sigma-54-dependent Fis family transcriptional regulator [Bryobacterales bacterium]|nr:Sigma-54-dependent Fis family transcriptional regulator [Bryobacterales bacterium]